MQTVYPVPEPSLSGQTVTVSQVIGGLPVPLRADVLMATETDVALPISAVLTAPAHKAGFRDFTHESVHRASRW